MIYIMQIDKTSIKENVSAEARGNPSTLLEPQSQLFPGPGGWDQQETEGAGGGDAQAP